MAIIYKPEKKKTKILMHNQMPANPSSFCFWIISTFRWKYRIYWSFLMSIKYLIKHEYNITSMCKRKALSVKCRVIYRSDIRLKYNKVYD